MPPSGAVTSMYFPWPTSHLVRSRQVSMSIRRSASGPLACTVQLRAHGETHPATAWLDGGRLRIRLREPARAVARGQAAVLYHGDLVLGSATIDAAHANVPA